MIGHLLNRAVDVYRETDTPDGSGGTVRTWALVASGLRVRVSQPTAAERVAAQQAGAEWDASVYLDPHADVRRGDELRAPEGSAVPEAFRVVSLVRPSVAVYLRADCERIQRRAEEWPAATTSR